MPIFIARSLSVAVPDRGPDQTIAAPKDRDAGSLAGPMGLNSESARAILMMHAASLSDPDVMEPPRRALGHNQSTGVQRGEATE
ncbi:hypothetical protein [Actinomadura sp. 3N407]|uniref:hypothetical protein n=1 Tax=Actinomadura sp. 3N407 TaxID=3457423 RepID=UPI003FCDEFE8